MNASCGCRLLYELCSLQRGFQEAPGLPVAGDQTTVVQEGGTAPKAALEGYPVAGKTGTAYKIEGGVYVNKYYSSFVGFFPADKPEVCILVSFDEPRNAHYGGDTAGPIFREIATQIARYLDIVPTESAPQPKEGVSVASLGRTSRPAFED